MREKIDAQAEALMCADVRPCAAPFWRSVALPIFTADAPRRAAESPLRARRFHAKDAATHHATRAARLIRATAATASAMFDASP